MGQSHGVIGKERFLVLGTFLHEFTQEIHIQFRAVLALGVRTQTAVLVDHRLMEARTLVPAKYTPLIKTHPGRLLSILFHQTQLPLAGNGCSVTCSFEYLCHCIFFLQLGERTPTGLQPERILAGHQANSCGMTYRHAEAVVKPHATLGQRVDVRCLPALATISTNRFAADVISHDQYNVWLQYNLRRHLRGDQRHASKN